VITPDVEALTAVLSHARPREAADALLAVAADEDARSRRNELKPYADLLPPALMATSPQRAAEISTELSGDELQRVLFGSFRQLSWPWLEALAQVVPVRQLVSLLDAMAVGVDAPRQAARLLAARASDETEVTNVLVSLVPSSGARILGAGCTAAPHADGSVPKPVPNPEPPSRLPTPVRRTEAPGVLVERIETSLPGAGAAGDGVDPIRIDLAELDLSELAIKVCHSGETMSFGWLAERVGGVGRNDARPQEELFTELGLVRLSEAVTGAGASAGINGNFYFDYGHYLDGLDLGIDLGAEPHVRLGNPIGWFVSGGEELTAPIVNRATSLVDEVGHVDIRRVFARSLRLRGRELTWERVDAPGDGVVLYTRLFGPTTPARPGAVDLTLGGGVVVEVRLGGGSRIPLEGLVLSLPPDQLPLVDDVAVDDAAVLVPDLPSGSPRIVEAMACGPLLVRDGQVDLDFATRAWVTRTPACLPSR